MSATTGPEAAPKPSAKSIYEQRKRYSTVVMADVSQYPVNHLVTFCLGEEDGVHTLEDASRKLAVMDRQGRVWAQEMLLRVSPGHVTLLDPVSKAGAATGKSKPSSRPEEKGSGEGVGSRPSRDSAWELLAPHRGCRGPEDPPSPLRSHQDPEAEAEPHALVPRKWVLCDYDFQARNSSELSVKHRDVLEVLDDKRKWWKVRDQQGREGYVPYNILSPHPGPQAGPGQGSSASNLDSTPPPPPAPAPARPHWDSCDSLNSLDPGEKGETVHALGVLTAAQLFSLQREEFRAVSPEEGARVYSQVTVQRALLEDSEKVSELQAVMEKQKKKVEGDVETEVI
ncbi:PREDICTED: epidermal growth factor receptor kinase substrate 8-like protein 1 [Condylura cristata]|uniref:epidermal growth factor receptor kinase substrate 8-like protein 1 n=1 Tax=Condylura cristata TaxID=143302 RepID=UPI0003345BF3|nr:PREDICTED: epidermal growth factor receptor kinase substrate 8-like protein 1 [Condylura cristata]